MPEVRVYLLGYPRVECDGVPVAVPRRKALALLAYLGVTQAHHSRDVLASLLWPEEEPARAYAFLRNALWVLHKTPLDPCILATRHMIGLRQDAALWVDVAEFRRLAKTCEPHKHPERDLCVDGAAALEAAVDLARDAFLSGFVAEDSRSFEEWQFGEADVVAQELALTLERLCDHYERVEERTAALRHAQRLLVLRPLDESATRRAMHLQARAGDRAGALRTYDECVRRLDEELSLVPSEETRALAEDLRTRAVPRQASDAAPSRAGGLPGFRLPLVGRDEDVAGVLALLSSDDGRLVTLTGAGGGGKTRVAVEVAVRATRFADGAVFVPLVDVESPALVPDAVLGALGEVAGTRTAAAVQDREVYLDELARHIADRDLLIVLDNVEQLAHDSRWLSRLLESTHRPRFLATSRQELGVPGEMVFPIEGLRYPPSDALQAPTEFAAVQLFVQAARRADGRFVPAPADASAIAAITRLLGGNPLGIELAASWVRTLTCAAIEKEIVQSVDFLRTDRQHVERRHRSLRAAFEGSWSLLDREGRAAFRCLSVFRGGFTPESASRVAGVALPQLASLVAKSLLERAEGGRYEMLEVVRQYASERLRAVPEDAQLLHDRHSEHFLALIASQESRLKGAEQTDAIALLTKDEANLAAAWRYAASRGAAAGLERSAMGLFLFCDMTSRFAVGRELFRAAATSEGLAGAAPVGLCVYLRGIEAWFTDFCDARASKHMFGEALARAADLPLNRDLAFVRVLASFSSLRFGASLRSQMQEAVAFFDEHGHAWEAAAARDSMTNAVRASPEALDYVRQSLEIREEIGDRWGIALGRFSEAMILQELGDLDGAAEAFTASANLRRQLGLDSAGLAFCYIRLGRLKAQLRRPAQARRDLEEAERIAAQIGYSFAAAQAFEGLAALEAAAHRDATARQYARNAAQAYLAAGYADRAAVVSRMLAEAPSTDPGAKRPRRG